MPSEDGRVSRFRSIRLDLSGAIRLWRGFHG
jgi:hypothetical protein